MIVPLHTPARPAAQPPVWTGWVVGVSCVTVASLVMVGGGVVAVGRAVVGLAAGVLVRSEVAVGTETIVDV